MSEHSILSPSSAHRTMYCTGSVLDSKDVPNTTSKYAEEGTRAHDLGSKWLKGDVKAKPSDEDDANDMGEYVAVYTNAIRRAAEGKLLMVEQALDISMWTTEVGGKGTGDAVIIDLGVGDIEIHDLKYGMGHVVDAEHNEQLGIYGLGALTLAESLFVDRVRNIKMVIHQPRRDHISEWEISREELLAFGETVKERGRIALATLRGEIPPVYAPSAEVCLWCPVKATCKAVQGKVMEVVFEDFEVLPEPTKTRDQQLSAPSPGLLDMIEEWVSGVREHIRGKLNEGIAVAGWKLVAGKKGNRAWKSVDDVDTLVRALKIKQGDAYTQKLKTPTQLEKIVDEKKWPKFEALITQAPAGTVMVPESDPKPAVAPAAKQDEFDLLG